MLYIKKWISHRVVMGRVAKARVVRSLNEIAMVPPLTHYVKYDADKSLPVRYIMTEPNGLIPSYNIIKGIEHILQVSTLPESPVFYLNVVFI